jgi:Fe-Mn family superoxide dismutase
MKKFEEQKFEIPDLIGISKSNIEEHLKLYAGYVTHSNLVLEKIAELSKDGKAEENMGLISGLQRRFGFEYNGMRNHEIYFNSFSGGPKELKDGNLKKAIEESFGSFEAWFSYFKTIATTRGIGWAILYFDRKEKRLLNAWIDEQHLGQLQDCAVVLALDMWEHSYVADYKPSGKKNYVEDFFRNLNWEVMEENFEKATKE